MVVATTLRRPSLWVRFHRCNFEVLRVRLRGEGVMIMATDTVHWLILIFVILNFLLSLFWGWRGRVP